MDPLAFLTSPLGIALIGAGATLLAALIGLASARSGSQPSVVVTNSPDAHVTVDNSWSMTTIDERIVIHAPSETGTTAEPVPVWIWGLLAALGMCLSVWFLAVHYERIVIIVCALLVASLAVIWASVPIYPFQRGRARHILLGTWSAVGAAWGILSLGIPVEGVPTLADIASHASGRGFLSAAISTWQLLMPTYALHIYMIRLGGLFLLIVALVRICLASLGHWAIHWGGRNQQRELVKWGAAMNGGEQGLGLLAFLGLTVLDLIAVVLMLPWTSEWLLLNFPR